MGVAQVARDLKTQSCPIAQIASRLHDACSLVVYFWYSTWVSKSLLNCPRCLLRQSKRNSSSRRGAGFVPSSLGPSHRENGPAFVQFQT
jgi:hypothetical protein